MTNTAITYLQLSGMYCWHHYWRSIYTVNCVVHMATSVVLNGIYAVYCTVQWHIKGQWESTLPFRWCLHLRFWSTYCHYKCLSNVETGECATHIASITVLMAYTDAIGKRINPSPFKWCLCMQFWGRYCWQHCLIRV